MCLGPEVMTAFQAFGAAASGLSALKTLTGSKASAAPEIVRTDPVADETAAKTQAAQDAQAYQIEQKKRLRNNSLLSQAGAAGDLSTADTAGGQAAPKLQLGA